MALPSSGELSFNAIANELGITYNRSLRNMSDLAGFSTPDSVSEFYSYDISDAQRYINAVNNAGTDLNSTQTYAIETLFSNLVDKGIYPKIYGFYPLLGLNAAQQRINAKSVSGVRQSAYDLNFAGGWTFSISGMAGNGGNTLYGIDFNYYTTGDLANSHFGVYQTAPDYGNSNYGYDIGIYNANFDTVYAGMSNLYDGASNYVYAYDISSPYGSSTINNPASTMMSRDGSTGDVYYFENGSLQNTSNQGLSFYSDMYVGGGYDPAWGYTSRTYGFITFGEFLTDTDMYFYQLYMNDFQTAIGRNIY